MPKILILGHSFVKRLQSDLKTTFDPRTNSNFHLEGTATVHLFGVGGRTVEKLTNDLSGIGPEVVGSSIEELVTLLLDAFSVSVVVVCHVIPRGVSFTNWEDFLQRAEILNNYVRVVLEPFPKAFCWIHRDFSSPHKDLYLSDGVHVNSLGQYFLYRSYRGAILKALGLIQLHAPS